MHKHAAKLAFSLAFIAGAAIHSNIYGEIQRQIHVTTSPEGAAVFIKLGMRNIPLGSTPLSAPVEFHSEQSIVRIQIRKPLYKPVMVEVQPGSLHVRVNLERNNAVMSNKKYPDPVLQRIHEKYAAGLVAILYKQFTKAELSDYDLAEPLFFEKLQDNVALIVPLHLATERRNLIPSKLNKEFAKGVWDRVSASLAKPLANRLSSDVTSVLLKVVLVQHGIGGGTQQTSHTVMTCRGGYNYVYQYQGGNMAYVPSYNPCLYQEPVTRTEQSFTGEKTQTGLAHLTYYADRQVLHGMKKSGETFDNIGVRVTDMNGNKRYTHGITP